MAEWDPEVEVSPELVTALLEEQHPDLAGDRPRHLGDGFDNSAFLVGEWVFRLPRRAYGGFAMEVELEWLPFLADHLSRPISLSSRMGTPTEEFPWCWGGYRKIAGETADRLHLSAREREELARPVAQFLRELHQIPIREDGPRDTLSRHDLRRRAPQLLERLRAAPIASEPLRKSAIAAVEALREVEPWNGTRHWCHGDLYSRHLLLEQGQLNGIIDWGDLHLGDIAVDLGIAWSFLPRESHRHFFAEYGQISADTWQRARFRALHYGASLLVYGAAVGDQDLQLSGNLALEAAIDF